MYVHKKSKDADQARHDIATTGKGYAKAHIDAPYTSDGIALTVSGVLPQNGGLDEDTLLQTAAQKLLINSNDRKATQRIQGVVYGDPIVEWEEQLLLAGIHPHLFPTGRGMQTDIERNIQFS